MLRTAHHTHASTINAEGLCTVASSVIRNRHSETHNETDTDGATQVQRHETDPGEPPMRLRAPGMHRVPSGDLLSNAVEDLGGGGALCRRAENLRPIRDM